MYETINGKFLPQGAEHSFRTLSGFESKRARSSLRL